MSRRVASIACAGVLMASVSTGAVAQSAPSNSRSETPRNAEAAGNPSASASPSAVPQGDFTDIVVTARRTAERLQDVPLAISAISGAGLQRQNITQLKDLSSTVPNLSIQPANSGGSGVQVTLRGQSQSNNGLLYIDPAVGIYVDGLNVPRNFGLRSGLVDIQRVEVLRGPQGTLYGRNTTGGAVSVLTNDPGPDIGAQMQAAYGNYNTYQFTGVANLPFSDNFSARFVAAAGGHGAFHRQQLTGVGLNDERNMYFRAKFKFDSGNVRASFTGDYFSYDSNGSAFRLVGVTPASQDRRFSGGVANVPGAVAPTAANPNGIGFYPVAGGNAAAYVQRTSGLPYTPAGLNQASAILQQFVGNGSGAFATNFYGNFGTSNSNFGFGSLKNISRSEGASAALNLELDLDDHLTARSISGFRYYNRVDRYDLDGTPFPFVEPINGTPFDNFYSQETQLLGKYDKLNFVLGGFFSFERGRDFTPSAGLQAAGATNYGLADGLSRNTSKAIFGQGTYKLTDGLSLTLGGRYTWDIRELDDANRSVGSLLGNGTRIETCGIPALFLATPGVCFAKFKTKYDGASYLASLDYKITQDVLVYAKIARGFRSGGLQGRANAPTQPLSFSPFEPEYVTEYEAGLKSDLFNRRLHLNLAAYYDKYTDVQRSITLVAAAANYTLVSNAAAARLYGFEGEASLRVAEGLRLNGTFGYLNARYKTFQDATLGDRSGEDWPAPKFVYTLSASYDKPTEFGSFAASVDWNHRSSENLQPQAIIKSQVTQPSYGLLNGRISASFDELGLDIALYGRNLTKRRFYTGGISLESLGLNTLLPGDPRTYGIQLTKKFGSFR